MKAQKGKKSEKPSKPYPDFPLFLHQTGQWAKKVRGKLHYFGTDADAALAKYLDQRDDLQAGRTPRVKADELTVRELVNRFLTAKKALLESEELSPRTWRDYYATAETLVEAFGKTRAVADLAGDDFEKLRSSLAKTRGPVALGNAIQRVRSVFAFAWNENLIEKPIRFGASFKKPSRKVIRKARQAAGSRMIEAEDLRKLITAARQPMRAMILLALNCGFGQSDIAGLPRAAIDLKASWIDFPRPKTAIPRRCPLWPETVTALSEALPLRPDAADKADDPLALLTRFGVAWVRLRDRGDKPATPIDSINLEFKKLLEANGAKHTGFYSLRHVHRTVADGAKDQPAADFIMGHVANTMASAYRERIEDDRLKAVSDHVHKWLFPPPKPIQSEQPKAVS